jgi:hypothetical protein
MTRRIEFAPATPEDFLHALLPYAREHGPAWLIGENPLAETLAEAAEAEGLIINRSAPPPDAGGPLIILTETSGPALQAELLKFAALQQAVILAPITDWHFTKLPLFLISIPKSGTHLIYELARAFGYHEGGEPP